MTLLHIRGTRGRVAFLQRDCPADDGTYGWYPDARYIWLGLRVDA